MSQFDFESVNKRMNDQEKRLGKRLIPGAFVMAVASAIAASLDLGSSGVLWATSALLAGFGISMLIRI